ncbi:MAG: hypothetical protein DRG39_01790 [Deltaproteobacteria bacterium]|nr:MAG: hypothetical protein DRG39_01790 [Deltaproteobacteria bacterium]
MRYILKGLCLVFVIVLFLGCGKKSPPFLPKSRLPFRVTFLEAEKKGNMLILRGEVVGKEGKKGFKLSDIRGCRVYYTRYGFKNLPCESCPIYYGEFKDIEGKVVKDKDFYCEIGWMNKKGIYFIRVRLLGPGISIGPPSNRVKIEIKEQ